MDYRISPPDVSFRRCDVFLAGSVRAVMALEAKILTVSESASLGAREDRSGDELTRVLVGHGFRIVDRRVVPDGTAPVSAALVELSTGFAGLVVTTGGTGFSPTDVTPEATRAVVEREAPGLAEAMRSVNPLGRLSRRRGGIRRGLPHSQRPGIAERCGGIHRGGGRRPRPRARAAGRGPTPLIRRRPDRERHRSAASVADPPHVRRIRARA